MNWSARRCCSRRMRAVLSPGRNSSWTAVSMRCQFDMKFCDKHFLLANDTARDLYHGTAAQQPIIDYHCHLSTKDLAVIINNRLLGRGAVAQQPIIDYHCHLSPKDLAEDRRFTNL